jgi:hypothetical protein
VRIRWQAREWERTCLSCGYVWRVSKGTTRAQGRGRPEARFGGQGADDVIGPSAALGEQDASLKECPHCGSLRYRRKLILP